MQLSAKIHQFESRKYRLYLQCLLINHKADAKHSTATKIIRDNSKLSKPPKNQIRMPINSP